MVEQRAFISEENRHEVSWNTRGINMLTIQDDEMGWKMLKLLGLEVEVTIG